MKKSSKILALILAALMLMSVLVACGGDTAGKDNGGAAAESAHADRIANMKDLKETDEIKIAYIPLSTLGQTNRMVIKGLEEFLVFYPNIKIETFEVTYDSAKQISTYEECITQGFDAIITEAMDAAASKKAIEKCEEAGIPVMTLNCGSEAIHSAHFQGNDYDSGVMIAKELVADINNKGKVIVLNCPAEQVAFSRMGTGFIDYVKANCPDVEILENQNIANWAKDEAQTVMRDLLTKYDDIQAVYGVSDDIALGALAAIEAANRENIVIWGRSGYPAAFTAIKEGRMAGTCYEDYYQEASCLLATVLYLIDTGTTAFTAGYTETPTVDFPLYICNQENVDVVTGTLRWDEVSE